MITKFYEGMFAGDKKDLIMKAKKILDKKRDGTKLHLRFYNTYGLFIKDNNKVRLMTEVEIDIENKLLEMKNDSN